MLLVSQAKEAATMARPPSDLISSAQKPTCHMMTAAQTTVNAELFRMIRLSSG